MDFLFLAQVASTLPMCDNLFLWESPLRVTNSALTKYLSYLLCVHWFLSWGHIMIECSNVVIRTQQHSHNAQQSPSRNLYFVSVRQEADTELCGMGLGRLTCVVLSEKLQVFVQRTVAGLLHTNVIQHAYPHYYQTRETYAQVSIHISLK